MTHRTFLWIIQRRDRDDINRAWQTVLRIKCGTKRAHTTACCLSSPVLFSWLPGQSTWLLSTVYPVTSIFQAVVWYRSSHSLTSACDIPLAWNIYGEPARMYFSPSSWSLDTTLSICCPINNSLLETGSRTQFFKHWISAYVYVCI